MKKILLLLFIALIGCAKEDLSNNLSGTEWSGKSELYTAREEYNQNGYSFWENTLTKDATIRFINNEKGSMVVIFTNSNPDLKEENRTETFAFSYTYDYNYKRGEVTYAVVPEEGISLYKSSFEIRDGFLYDDSDIVGEIEYYQVK